MPLLSAWLTSIFVSWVGYFAVNLTKKAAMIAAGIATFSGIVASMYAAMAALVAGASYAFPNGGLIATGVWLFLPDNAIACMTIMIAADVCMSLFFWQSVNLQIAMKGIA